MPRGTCQVCGCTEANPCDGGCSWVGGEQVYCSQCVAWALLATPNPYEGIMPFDLVPVRTVHPMRCNHPSGLAYPLDQRRVNAETRERLAYTMAPRLGITVEEFLEKWETGGVSAAAIPQPKVKVVLVAENLEQAAVMLEQYRATGLVEGGRRFDVLYGEVINVGASTKPGGGAHRG